MVCPYEPPSNKGVIFHFKVIIYVKVIVYGIKGNNSGCNNIAFYDIISAVIKNT